jgi:hypothetical protein
MIDRPAAIDQVVVAMYGVLNVDVKTSWKPCSRDLSAPEYYGSCRNQFGGRRVPYMHVG